MHHYHLSGFSASNGEFEIGILLPVTEKQRKFCKETVVNIASGRDRLRTGISVQAAFERFCSGNQLLPGFVVIGARDDFRVQFLQLSALDIVGAICVIRHGGGPVDACAGQVVKLALRLYNQMRM